MKVIVITGSTRGIGRGLANEFLKRDCAVMISGRTSSDVEDAVQQFAAVYGAEHVSGQACNVREPEQVQALWDAAQVRFGHVDVWINNAGLSHATQPFWEVDCARVVQVIETNLLGMMHGTRVAFAGMRAQGSGFIYNMEGLGSTGPTVKGMAYYASSKSALTKFTQTAIKDAEDTPVKIGFLSPGMVVTDLLTGEEQRSREGWERSKRLYNILADQVETVTPWLVEKVLSNQKHGVRIAWLTTLKTILRFLKAPFVKRDLFAE